MTQSTTHSDWHVSSWRDKEILQQPSYPDEAVLGHVLGELSRYPPLVTSWEILKLKEQLADATAGRRFLLQGGDCAESLDECTAPVIANRLKVLLQMSIVLLYGLRLPIIRVGRFAGQYAKPRSNDFETRGSDTLPSYRGDLINRSHFSESDRIPRPELMLKAYGHSALTLNFMRALAQGGFADLHHPEYWKLDFLRESPFEHEYRAIVHSILDAVRFMETVHDGPIDGMEKVDLYTSHEALLLPYEEALTRTVPHVKGVFNLSTHFPWIGMRTANLESAHVEYMRGLSNPIAMKVGANIDPSDLVHIVNTLNPSAEPGRLTLITRLGVDGIEKMLPSLIETVRSTGKPVLWSCDPMHGNTHTTVSGKKTRRFDDILGELELAFDVHEAEGSALGGVHLEMTGERVTECLGGARGLVEEDLSQDYRSLVDPRLNVEQALEIAFAIVRKRRNGRRD